MLEEKMSLEERAENLVSFARNTNENELDNVIEAVVNFVREERIKVLKELESYITTPYETIVKKRQRQETAKLSER
jgi:hypothetical protein